MIVSTEREAELLANLLRQPAYIKAVSLSPEQFSDNRNQKVFRAMKALQDKLVTPTELKRELDNHNSGVSVDYISALVAMEPDSVDILHVKSLAVQISESSSRARTIVELRQNLSAMQNPALTYHDALGATTKTIVQAQRDIMSQSSPDIADILDNQHERRFGKRFYTGLSPDFDIATRGYREGQIVNLNAPYKGFKTRWTLNMAIGALKNGIPVAYEFLEDSSDALTEKIIAILTGCHEQDVEMYFEDDCPVKIKQALKKPVTQAMDWLREQPLRIYDIRHGVMNPETLKSRVLADKMSYGTSFHIIDHVNQYSESFEVLSAVYRSFVEIAQDAQVCILGLSQQSNANILFGTQDNMLAARGTGVAGAVVHFGFEAHKPKKGEGWFRVLDEVTKKQLELEGATDVQVGDAYLEIGLHLKILRRGKPTKFWGLFEPTSGRLVAIRSDRGEPTDINYGSFTNWDWEKK